MAREETGIPPNEAASPTVPPPPHRELGPVLERNILALRQRRDAEEAQAGFELRIGDAITRFTGSMRFVYLHLVVFGFWIAVNLGWAPGVPQWDESLVMLAMIASVEAIFLSTFVLMSQNRMQAAADRRADLDLQVSLLAEHEITRLFALTAAIADRLGVSRETKEEEEITRDIAPEAVLDGIEETREDAGKAGKRPVNPG
jgi:uncharacterized membrane protein